MGRQIKNYRSWLDVENDKSLGNVVAVNHFTKGPTNRLARIIELQPTNRRKLTMCALAYR
jgi:hypothetical protein